MLRLREGERGHLEWVKEEAVIPTTLYSAHVSFSIMDSSTVPHDLALRIEEGQNFEQGQFVNPDETAAVASPTSSGKTLMNVSRFSAGCLQHH